ncbi:MULTISPECIES: response regulator [Halorussus]|uniref:response regulator n=1 Tax=Halorussus TaxID=1070314 RepID=UPI0020A06AAF|nr:response regulator [Halorussus vallis]USZ76570.1 response regulator [Halorussus vallis]
MTKGGEPATEREEDGNDGDEAAVVLALGRRRRNLQLLSDLLADEYRVEIVRGMAEFDRLVERRDDVSLAILDVDGFTEDVWRRCEQLYDRDVPMLVLAASIPPAMREVAMSNGVHTLLEKPVEKADLRASVRGLVKYIDGSPTDLEAFSEARTSESEDPSTDAD